MTGAGTTTTAEEPAPHPTTDFEKYSEEEIYIFFHKSLANAFKEQNKDVNVLTKIYYSNYITLVVTPFDYFLIVISISKREHCIPKSTSRYYLRTQLGITEILIKKWFGSYIKGKKCSGIFTVRVGNYSKNVTGFRIYKTDKGYYEADLVIQKDDDHLWFYAILERLEKWLLEREKGLLDYTRSKGIRLDDNKLLKIISNFIMGLRRLKTNLKYELESWREIDPLHKAVVLATTSILGTIGVQRTLKNVKTITNILSRELNLGKITDISYILEKTCRTLENNEGIKEFIPPRKLKTLAFQVLQTHIDQPVWFKYANVKPIKVLDSIVDDVSYCLAVLLAHIFTRNGIIFEKIDTIASLTHSLLTTHGIEYDSKELDYALYNALKKPTILLPPHLFKRAWKIVYYTFKKRRRLNV